MSKSFSLCSSSRMLVSLGLDEDEPCAFLKIWNMDSNKEVRSRLVREIKLATGSVSVTTLACLEDLSQIAVGLSDGSVLLLAAGDLLREKSIRQKIVLASSGSPVTGMGFLVQKNGAVVLFVSTTDKVVQIVTSAREAPVLALDDVGCEANCSTMTDTGEFAMGREEAVYFYTPEGRGACRPFEGRKLIVTWFRSYLLIVSEDPNNKQMSSVNIYNLQNQFNAFSGTFAQVNHVSSEWGSVFLFCQGGKLYQLEEKDTQTKLETLFKRGLYNVALSVAQSQNYDEAAISDIHRKFGDHLYLRSDFDSAIESYVRTITHLEPSYVIRKFLDAQRIHNLTTYLQALHQKGVANADHTTLLLNCYTKLKYDYTNPKCLLFQLFKSRLSSFRPLGTLISSMSLFIPTLSCISRLRRPSKCVVRLAIMNTLSISPNATMSIRGI